jgi:heme/copper-type cytochrome/quinol oxidase subunit 2
LWGSYKHSSVLKAFGSLKTHKSFYGFLRVFAASNTSRSLNTNNNYNNFNSVNEFYFNTRTLINNSSLLIPLYCIIKILLLSYDVIHSIGFYSIGIKMDAIPARINLTQSLRPLFKGEYRGFCFESCGQGHGSMLLTAISLKSLNYLFLCIIITLY